MSHPVALGRRCLCRILLHKAGGAYVASSRIRQEVPMSHPVALGRRCLCRILLHKAGKT